MRLFDQLYDSIAVLVSFKASNAAYTLLLSLPAESELKQLTKKQISPINLLLPYRLCSTAKEQQIRRLKNFQQHFSVCEGGVRMLSKSVCAERGRFSANNSACPSQDDPPALPNKHTFLFVQCHLKPTSAA